MNALRQFLEERRSKFGTLQNLAKSMGITFSGFLRGVKQGTLSTDNCLLLAEVLGEEPSSVFRAAKKHDLAARFDRLYGKTSNPITGQERELLAIWNATPQPARSNLLVWLSHMVPQAVTVEEVDTVDPPARVVSRRSEAASRKRR